MYQQVEAMKYEILQYSTEVLAYVKCLLIRLFMSYYMNYPSHYQP